MWEFVHKPFNYFLSNFIENGMIKQVIVLPWFVHLYVDNPLAKAHELSTRTDGHDDITISYHLNQ